MPQQTNGLASVIADKRRPNAAFHATYTPQNWSVLVLHPGEEEWQPCRTGGYSVASGTYTEVLEEMKRPIIGVRLVDAKGKVHREQLTEAVPMRQPEPKRRPMRRRRA